MVLHLPVRKYAFVAVCFLASLIVMVTIDYDDRGPHFATAGAKTDRDGTYDLAKARALARVVGHIRSHYVDPERVEPKEMVVAALMRVQSTVPEVMIEVERDRKNVPTKVTVTVDATKKTFGLERVGDLYELNWKLMDVFDFLERNLPPPVDLQALEYQAVNGLLSTLDPHTLLLPPQVYREMQLGQRGRFGGLGITVSISEGILTITSVMAGTPAATAKLEDGDEIVQIGAESTINMSLNEAVNLLRGEPESQVTVWIRREGWESAQPIGLTRKEIRLPSVDKAWLGDGIAYVHVRGFQGNTADNLHEALIDLTRANGEPKGLVIDLRDNPGGLLDKAIEISDTFIESGTIVTTVREGAREREESHATHANTLEDLPLVVLINRGSASASEIVAGALKRNDRAVILGERSFGKGSVQVVYTIDEAALKLTIAQYLTPGDVSIQSVGIVPDIEIQGIEATKDRLNLYPSAQDAKGEKDLDSHLDNTRTIDSQPSVQLRIVEAATADGKPRPPRKNDYDNDALTLLAKDLLKAAPSPNRKQALVQASGFLAERAAREEAALTAQLATLGVDWAIAKTKAAPKLAVSVTVLPVRDGATPNEALRAGDKVRLTATVTNNGKEAVYRLHGLIKSALTSLGGRELAFGLVRPGATIKRSFVATLAKRITPSGDNVTLQLLVDGGAIKMTGSTEVTVKQDTLPLFAHRWQVIDRTGAGSEAGGVVKGNGDGLIQRGESIRLAVWVTNVGGGSAANVLASIKNESGQDVFITEGRRELGPLKAGETKRAVFDMTVRDSLKARTVQLKLSVIDQLLQTWVHSQLSPRVFPAGFPKRTGQKGVVMIGDAATAIHGGAHRESPELGEVLSGAVLRQIGVAGDWLEVSWTEGAETLTGWVTSTRATHAESGGITEGAVTEQVGFYPPTLTLALPELVTDKATVTLGGKVAYRGGGGARRHVYIFRGSDKVFFQSAETGDDATGELTFAAPIGLVKGSNVLTIVAREGEDRVTRRNVTVFRR
ncbi:MAG: carboxyl-terminal processing protease [Myxococcota bacterium]|jgi:carboxyl-terminal processing protease